jgi:predicted kinase
MAAFHAGAPTGPGVDEWGALPNVQRNWEDNLAQIAPHVDVTVPSDELAAIEVYVRRFLHERRALIQARVASGRVRDGHGDLHADSICLHGRQLVIFDCLEFSPRYRCADVAAEIAFLAMDLEHMGRPDLAWAFISEYVRASGDDELPELLDFYRCYRAFVRGKVRSLRVGQAPPEEAPRVVAEARSYFDLAARYALWSAGACSRFRPRLVVTCGLPAVGKSTLAQGLAERLGLLRVSTDVVRKERAGLPSPIRNPQSAIPNPQSAFGSGLYSASATGRTYAALRRRAGLWLRRGVSVVLDGTFGSRSERRLTVALARRAGARFLLVHIIGNAELVKRRFRARAKDPARVSDATWGVYQQMREIFEPPDEVAPGELIVDDTAGERTDEIVAHLLFAPNQPSQLNRI